MKKLLFLSILLASELHAKQIILDIPDSDLKIVENDVPDAEAWIKNAWAGKLNKCKERLVKAEIEKSMKSREAIPAGEDAIVQKAFLRTDYKNRVQRDSEADAIAKTQAADRVRSIRPSPTLAPN